MFLASRDLSKVEWMFPTSVHERTRCELITASYQFSFLLLFVLYTPWPRVKALVGRILFTSARNGPTNTLQSLFVVVYC